MIDASRDQILERVILFIDSRSRRRRASGNSARRRRCPINYRRTTGQAETMTAKQPKRQADIEKWERETATRDWGGWWRKRWRIACRENHEWIRVGRTSSVTRLDRQFIMYAMLTSVGPGRNALLLRSRRRLRRSAARYHSRCRRLS